MESMLRKSCGAMVSERRILACDNRGTPSNYSGRCSVGIGVPMHPARQHLVACVRYIPREYVELPHKQCVRLNRRQAP